MRTSLQTSWSDHPHVSRTAVQHENQGFVAVVVKTMYCVRRYLNTLIAKRTALIHISYVHVEANLVDMTTFN